MQGFVMEMEMEMEVEMVMAMATVMEMVTWTVSLTFVAPFSLFSAA